MRCGCGAGGSHWQSKAGCRNLKRFQHYEARWAAHVASQKLERKETSAIQVGPGPRSLAHRPGMTDNALSTPCPESSPSMAACLVCLPDLPRVLPQATIAGLEAAAEAADSAAAPAVMDFTWLTQVLPPAPLQMRTAAPRPSWVQ